MAINLIDPNDVIGDLNSPHLSAPNQEELFIFVELTAMRRGSTIIVNNGQGRVGEKKEGLPETKINLLGFDPDSEEFTTRYTENFGNINTPFEGFGISEIRIKTNSSFIPQIEIDFIDVRGQSLFNVGADSPYATIHSFPPPIFDLKIKGYYGLALDYQLHLVKHQSKFDARTGNYYMTVQFIARTFAPLTDILFKYIDTIPLIGTDISGNTKNVSISNGVAPKNINELLTKNQRLYDDISDLKNLSPESKELNDINIQMDELNNIISLINSLGKPKNVNNFILSIDDVTSSVNSVGNDNVTIPNNITDDSGQLLQIENVGLYNKVFLNTNSSAIDHDINPRLLLAVRDSETRASGIESLLENTKKELIDRLEKLIGVDIKDTDIVTYYYNNEQPLINLIVGKTERKNISALDISIYYQKIYKRKIKLNDDRIKILKKMGAVVDQIVFDNLGWENGPTIYNVFKILLDDVDVFFNMLRKTSIDADKHHEKYDSEIRNIFGISTNIKNNKPIHAWPLYQKNVSGKYKSYTEDQIDALSNNNDDLSKNQIRNNEPSQINRFERAYIGDDLTTISEPFPETLFVNDFINTFIGIAQQNNLFDLKNQEDELGNNKWIPATPQDSILAKSNSVSPYLGLYNTEQIYNQVINRFIIISQFTYGEMFYKKTGSFSGFFENKFESGKFITFVANAEAKNLANSIINSDLNGMLINDARKLSENPEIFYRDLPDYIVNGFGGETNTINGTLLAVDRRNPDYTGFNTVESVSEKTDGLSVNNSLIDDFVDNAPARMNRIFSFFKRSKGIDDLKFTKENAIYHPQSNSDRHTKFLKKFVADTRIDNDGRTAFGSPFNFIDVMANILSRSDVKIEELLKNDQYSSTIKSFFITSIFGYATSFFDESVNPIFGIPGVVRVPQFAMVYMGGLSYYMNAENNVAERLIRLEEFETFFSDPLFVENNSNFPIDRYDLSDDLSDTNTIKLLSVIDKKKFEDAFERYVNNQSNSNVVIKDILEIIENQKKNTDVVGKEKRYADDLTKNFTNIMKTLNFNEYIVNYSQITFEKEQINRTYESLSETNSDPDKIKFNNLYFETFFKELESSLKKKSKDEEDNNNSFVGSINDSDIKNQCYYSFKSINDKWLAGLDNTVNGYPFNEGSTGSLINLFKFVDRGMNDISNECIIDMSPLLDMRDDYDVSIFTVISRLLSHNGFEFFPLQNFMAFTEEAWEKSFKPSQDVLNTARPAFVCMYVGGTSSQLNDKNSDYDDDGIQDLENGAPPDMLGINDNTTDSFPHSKVRAFKVGFGKQNQSLFTDITLDTNDHKETNESLAILSEIAKDESKSTPVPKAQNLFETYSQRSYSCKVEMLGDMMIQPTQYFQLENVPMFSGAYIILDVDHSIKPNHMLTAAKGVRIAKIPIPFIKDFATTAGINLGITKDSSLFEDTSKLNFGNIEPPIINSMTTQKLSPFKSLTTKAEELIMEKTSFENTPDSDNPPVGLLSGRFYWELSDSNVGAGTTFKAAPKDDKDNIITENRQLGESLILWYNRYAKLYDLDANIILAQAYQESGGEIVGDKPRRFITWAYSKTGALGISQFLVSTLFFTVIKNNLLTGATENQKFTQEEIDAITLNMSGNTNVETSYNPGVDESTPETSDIARYNRGIIHQNIMDNPKIMIKAQCYLMKYVNDGNNNLAASSLFAYNRGHNRTSKYYPEAIRKAYGKIDIKEGINYVDIIFKILKNYMGYKDIIDTNVNHTAMKGGYGG